MTHKAKELNEIHEAYMQFHTREHCLFNKHMNQRIVYENYNVAILKETQFGILTTIS